MPEGKGPEARSKAAGAHKIFRVGVQVTSTMLVAGERESRLQAQSLERWEVQSAESHPGEGLGEKVMATSVQQNAEGSGESAKSAGTILRIMENTGHTVQSWWGGGGGITHNPWLNPRGEGAYTTWHNP